MHYGSSEEETSEEEAGPQDRGGEEKTGGEEDGHCPSQDRQEEEIAFLKGAGLVPAPSLFFP